MYLWRYILQILMSDFILGKACVHVCTFFVCLGTHVCASSSVYMCAHVYTCSGSQWTTFEAFSTLPTFVFSRQGLSQLIDPLTLIDSSIPVSIILFNFHFLSLVFPILTSPQMNLCLENESQNYYNKLYS